MISEVYAKIGGSYENAKSRLMSDRIIERMALKFPKDPSFQQLSEAMEAKDVQKAFMAVHTMKGVALNLSFMKLGNASAALTDAMRENVRANYTWEQYQAMFSQVEQEYQKLMAAIKEYQQE